MLSVSPKSRSSGFSLIELMMAIAITVIALGIAIPSFRVMLLNTEIRNAAESIQTGLMQARAEAIYSQKNVEFVLGAIGPGDQTSWLVQVLDPPNPPTVINRMASREGSADVIRDVVLPAGATTVTFDLTGRPLAINADGTAPLTVIHLDLPVSKLSNADSKDLSVTINFFGKIQMCDPNIMTPDDPRRCIYN